MAKISEDVGATYSITIDGVVWEGKIPSDGRTKWLLKNGEVTDAISAIKTMTSVVVKKTEMAPTTPVEGGTVTVTIDQPAADATLKLKTIVDGKVKWVDDSCSVSIVDGVAEVTVQIAGRKVPLISSATNAAFVQDSKDNRIWTAKVPTDGSKAISVTAGTLGTDFRNVTLTQGSGVTILYPVANDAGAATMPARSRESGKFGPVTFTVDVPAGVPRVPQVDGTAGISYKNIGGTKWEVTLDDIVVATSPATADTLTGSISALAAAPTVKVTSADTSVAQLKNTVSGTAPDGTFKFDVYVTSDCEPMVENLNGAKATWVAKPDDRLGNMECWTVTVTEINGNKELRVNARAYQTLEITGCGKDKGIVLDLPNNGNKIRVVNSAAEFIVYVRPDKKLNTKAPDLDKHVTQTSMMDRATGGKADYTITPAEPKKFGDNEVWSGWKISLKNIKEDATTYALAVTDAGYKVNVIAPVGTGITPSNQTVYSDKDGTIEFTVTTNGDVKPIVKAADIRPVNKGGIGGTGPMAASTATVKKTANADEWKITVTNISKTGDLHIEAHYLPEFSVVTASSAGSGIALSSSSPVPAKVVLINGEEWYEATFTFTKPDSSRLVLDKTAPHTAAIMVDTTTPTSGYVLSNPVETRNGYTLTARVKRNPVKTPVPVLTTGIPDNMLDEAKPGNKPLPVVIYTKTTNDYTVTLKTDENVTMLDDAKTVTVAAGGTARYNFSLKDGYEIVKPLTFTPADAKVELSVTSGSLIALTVTNVKADVEINLATKYIGNLGFASYTATNKSDGHLGTVNSNHLFGSDGGKEEGRLIYGGNSWEISAGVGYKPVITVTAKDSGADLSDKCTVEYNGVIAGHTRTSKWTVTVSGITKDVDIKFSAVKIIQPSKGADGVLDITTNNAWTGITIADTVKANCSDKKIASSDVELANTVVPALGGDGKGNKIAFVVYVAKGCNLKGVVTEGKVATNDTVSFKEEDEFVWEQWDETVPTECRPVLVTITLETPVETVGGDGKLLTLTVTGDNT